jgi:flagellar basal body-associated protein FliL
MPAFSKENQPEPEKKDAAVQENGEIQNGESRSPIFRSAGKYFLLVILVLPLAGGAYFLVDKFYEDIYGATLGRTSDNTVTYVIDEIIANPAGTNASRFLVVEIGLVLANRKDADLVDKHLMQIKDRINEVLSTKSVNELIHTEGRNDLRVELAEEINHAIGVRSVRNLYFIKYVIQ